MSTPGRRSSGPEQRSTYATFLLVGLVPAAWASLLPFVKARVAVNDGTLGLLLLCQGIGSIIAMPIAGAMADRFGCRLVLIIGGLLIGVTLPPLVTISAPELLAPALFILGTALGAIDCTVNIQAVIVERARGKALMSGFHGFYSLGSIVGAAGMSGLLTLGTSPLIGTFAAVALVAGLLSASFPGLLPYGSSPSGSPFALPRGVVLFWGALCFVVFLCEGAMLDWSAIYLTEQRDVPSAHSGFGYACFALAMTLGRLSGDAIVTRFGPRVVVGAGGLLAAVGLALTTLIPSWEAALLGFAFVGFGCSNIVPILYSALGRQKTMPQSAAIPALSTLGFAGVLTGPAGIGFVAQRCGLSTAFLIVAILMAVVALSGRTLRV